MRKCRSCQESIQDDARYCPFCGAGVIEMTLTCPDCGEENEMSASACSRCGFNFFTGKKEARRESPQAPPSDDLFGTAHIENAEQEIADRFSLAFERRLAEEHKPLLHNAYIDRFYQSDFKQSVEFRIQQLAEQVLHLPDNSPEKNRLLGRTFEELLDFFIIRYCSDLNEASFPEQILRWQGIPLDKVELGELIADYLELQREEESVYTNFVTMPANKLKNAAENFLFPQKGETIYFICDLSILGNCKEGFAMTRDCIYWKIPLEKKQRVYYKNLKEIKRQEDWITINGIFFNANKSLNLKILRLLKKLKEMYNS